LSNGRANASTAQSEQLAQAYESGDAVAIGVIGGQILATLPVIPAGTIGSVSGAIKTTDQVVVDATAASSIWSSTKSLTSVENAFTHWQKHSSGFPELANATQYVEAAQAMVTNPPEGALIKVRSTDTLIDDPASNIFAVKSADGVPRTMFKPTGGINYWNAQ
jgi:filamentous hemagglutinin